MSRETNSRGGADEDVRVPLCVDLDDTLVRTDTLWECLVQLWRRPFVALRALRDLLIEGKASFKATVAAATQIDAAALPYREEVLALVRSEHARGREVILATAAHRSVAEGVARHVGLFGQVFATEREVNLSGPRKQTVLEMAFGGRGFDYVGDGERDLPVFAAARKAILVNPSASLLRKASSSGNVLRVVRDDRSMGKTLARALRLHQWAKNVLLVVPLLAAHLVLDLEAWMTVGVAFVAFSLVASATYLVNDLVDLESDRLHPQKRFRPLASGRLAIRTGVMLAAGAGALGLALAVVLLPTAFLAYLAAYAALTLAYSFDLKRRLLVDALTLALLYTLRILAGGAAVGVGVSEWLLMFSLFIFLSLAFLKRTVELAATTGDGKVAGRGYSPSDLETIRIIGVSAGLLSVLVFALYIGSPVVSRLYRSPQLLWLICPLLIYWIARIWFLAARGEVHHDPVVFALLDWRSYTVAAVGLAIVGLATIGPAGIHW